MDIIIAGSRNLDIRPDFINSCIELFGLNPIETVFSGHSGKVDLAGESWANIWQVGTKLFPANWDKYNKAAGPIRNKDMAQCAGALLLIWDGTSKGSSNMRNEMLKLKKPIYEVIIREIE